MIPIEGAVGSVPKGWHKLRPYQKDAAMKLVRGEAVGLWEAAGVGKTVSLLAAAWVRMCSFPWLFVTRAVGRHAFVRDARWLLGREYVPGILRSWKRLSTSGLHRDGTYTDLDLLLSERLGCVVNYEILDKRFEELINVPWGVVILDEAHSIKGGYQRPQKRGDGKLHFRRYHYVKEIVREAQQRRTPVWEATATPIRNRRIDLWAQLDLVLPGKFGTAFDYGEVVHAVPVERARSFARRYCNGRLGNYGEPVWDGKSMTDELNRRCCKHFVMVARAEIADQLPAMQRDVRTLTVDRSSMSYLGGGVEEALARAAHAKIPQALDIVVDYLEGGSKVLIAVNRRKLAREVALVVSDHLSSRKVSPRLRREASVSSVTGDVPVAQRVKELNEFNLRPGVGVMVATMDCMRESIDMHYVEGVIVLALPYSPGDIDQFEGRFARLGGVPCTIHYLVAEDSIDERVRDMLLDKLGDVVDVGTDTAGARTARDDLAGCYDREAVLADLRAWLGAE